MFRSSPLVFINYRDCDQPWAAVLLDHVLSRRLGDDAVFLDSRSVLPGAEFDQALLTAVQRSEVLLVVVGDQWLAAQGAHGRRLIDRRQDWVRREIAAAFASQTTVVPVLIGDAAVLRPETLPTNIRRLATCQYVRLRHRDSRQDLTHLLNLLPKLIPTLQPTASTVQNIA
jgi:hypothetical protein